MKHRARLVSAAVGGALIVSAAAAMPSNAARETDTSNPNSDSAAVSSGVDASSAIVELTLDPLTTAPKTKPAPGKKVDFSSAAVKSQRARLTAQRNEFKKWLKANAPKVKVTGEYDLSLNAVTVALHGTSLDALRAAPQVKAASYEGLYSPTADTSYLDLSLINAVPGTDTAADAGAGVKVAIIDTGIDIRNPCFGGTDAGVALDKMTSWTNDKVVVADVFYNKAKQQGLTAAPVQDHGTHVAGTVACEFGTTASVNGVTITDQLSGVAPAALLGNYNIFPGEVTNARSEDILNALEAAYRDGMDVANMSLGGDAHGVQDLLTVAVDNLDQGGMVIAVANGNSGPGHYTVESPGSAARALSAGASTVGHFVGAPVSVNEGSYLASAGDFATVSADLKAQLKVVKDGSAMGLACDALDAGSLDGKIAVISRGSCSFSTKIRNAQDAGAAAALIVNNVAGDPTAMGQDGTADQPSIPAYMMSLADKSALMAADGMNATISADDAYAQTGNNNIMAGFSSQGPTDVDYRVKPDVVAPGVNVLSSIPNEYCVDAPCFAFFQGTSMATPHLAGTAAVLIAEHPDWSAAQVRSAIVNTAAQGVLTDSATGTAVETDPNIVGAGLEDVTAAMDAEVALDPVSISFGSVPSGSGRSLSQTLTLTSLDGDEHTYALSVSSASGSGVTFSAPNEVTVPASGAVSITVTAQFTKGASKGDHYATLTLGDAAHAVLYTFAK